MAEAEPQPARLHSHLQVLWRSSAWWPFTSLPAGWCTAPGWTPAKPAFVDADSAGPVGASCLPGHRLDKGTSGVLVSGAATRTQARAMTQLFEARQTTKDYLAWYEGGRPR